MKYTIETYGRRRGEPIRAYCNTLGLAIKIAKEIRNKLEVLKEMGVYIDIFESSNEKFVREGYMPSQVSYVSGTNEISWEGKRIH